MEQRLQAAFLRHGPMERCAAMGIGAVAIGTGILLAAWGISFLWRFTPPEIAVRIANPELRVRGSVYRGDVVEVCSPDGSAIARGLSNYSSTDVDRIRGKKTADVRALLAEAAYDEVVHRDNLVIG